MTTGLVFVTGASGFLGSHIVQQLLNRGYRVRGAARGKKAEALKAVYKGNASVEIVEISDIVHQDFPQLLEGVDAVIHTASPLPGRQSREDTLKSAIEGSLNVLRQAEKLGIKKFVVTSSVASAVNNANGTLTYKDWNVITKEHALVGDSDSMLYAASKKFAELAIWEWADAHPHVDVTTILPPYLYGPILPSTPTPPLDWNSVSTSLMIWNFITPKGLYPARPNYADVRDAAIAHVNALQSRPASIVDGHKRVLFASPHEFKFKDALEIIRAGRPELTDRLIKADPPTFDVYRAPVDFERIESIVGIKKEEFYSMRDTLLDTVDSVLEIEKKWRDEGYTVDHIAPMHS